MNNIQIFEIELKDYRQYKDVVSIPLETDGDRHINVIEGQNGAGKSNLLNAITLCFYDRETHIENKREKGLEADPYVNLKRLEDVDPGDTATGYVEVTLGRERPQWVFRRSFTTAKLEDGNFENTSGDLELDQRFGEDWEPMDTPNTRLNQILPNHVHEYFLFDGEQLDEFFEEGYTSRVQDAILDVSHIELLNKSTDHLDTVRGEYEKQAGKVEGEANKLQREYQDEKDELERLKKERKQVERDLEDARENHNDIEDRLSDSKDEEVQEKIAERQYLQERLEDKEEKLETAQEESCQALASAGMIAYNEDALQYTADRFEEMEAQGELPPKIQKWFVDQLLERNECICGECVDDDEERHRRLRELREEVADIDEGNIKGRIEIPHILEQSEEAVNDLLDQKLRIEDIEDGITEIDTDLEEIHAFLENKDIPEDIDVSYLESRRQEIQERIDDMLVRKGQLDSKIERQQEVVDEKYEEWQDELAKEERHASLLAKIQFIDKAEAKIEAIRDEILEEVRVETQEYLERYYNELIWKNEHYDITLTDTYQVEISGPSGPKQLASLSAGERQVLALSFMAALSQISGFSAPVLIDTPLGRISSEPKKLIAQNVPNYMKDSQITFLMTDEEYSQEVRVFFKQHVANEYELDYHDEVTEVMSQ